jgi:hypothetical protein
MHGLGRGNKDGIGRHGRKDPNRKAAIRTGTTAKNETEKTKPGIAKGESGLMARSSLAVLFKRPQAEQIGAGQV